MKTGDIILVQGMSKRAKAIQKFQKKCDYESGKYNHSGILYWSKAGELYVCEAAEIQQRKVKAAVIFTPFDYYKNGEYQLLRLQPKQKANELLLERELFKYTGTPYEYINLIIEQPIRILTGLWIGRNKKADKRMICHEFAMTVWQNVAGIFPDCRKGNVANIYHSTDFNHFEL